MPFSRLRYVVLEQCGECARFETLIMRQAMTIIVQDNGTWGEMMPSNDSLVGKTLGSYQIQREIGRGGMGVVYLAHEQSLRRVVAVKVLAARLTDDAAYVKRFIREARAAAQLDHPNIVTVHSVGERDGLYYIAMQYVEGRSLAQLIREKGPLDWRSALDITRQAAEALAEAHKRGIIHRDIKPDNIMIDEAGRVKVMDFGLARAASATTKLTADGAQLGTPMYMSPEQINGDPVDVRADIYSLGVMLYEMLAGRPPFQADTPMALMYQITHRPLPDVARLNATVPKIVAGVVAGMTAQQPEQRFPSAQTLGSHVSGLLSVSSRAPEHQVAPQAAIELDAQLRSDILGTGAGLDDAQATREAGPKRLVGPMSQQRRPIWIVLPVALVVLLIIVGAVQLMGRREVQDQGWITLFNGMDFEGWEDANDPTVPIEWSVMDGAMAAAGERKDIRTKQTWRDFDAELEYMVAQKGNGGVFLRGLVEIQVAGPGGDPGWEDGCIYNQFRPLAVASRPPGQWNKLSATYVGQTLTVKLNGVLIHDRLMVREYYAPDGMRTERLDEPGPLLLQAGWKANDVYYRNVRIRRIGADDR